MIWISLNPYIHLQKITILFPLLEMATPGWGPRHPPGPPPRDGGWGRGIDYPKPRGMGNFFENPPGVFGGFYVIKMAVFIEILL